MFHETQASLPLNMQVFGAYRAQQQRVCEAEFQCALFEEAPEDALSIYVLRDPLTPDPFDHPDGAVFYVGQTENTPRRFCEHVRPKSLAGQNLAKCERVYAIQNAGYSPSMDLLNRVSRRHSAVKAEEEWIQYFRSMGYQLANGGRSKKRRDFSHCLEPDGSAELATLAELVQLGAEIMLQCLECCHLEWRDPANLIEASYLPAMTIAQYRAHMRTCSHCGSGAIIAGVEEKGEVA